MHDTDKSEDTLDYVAVRRYFESTPSESAASASYMAHEQNLPVDAVRYRLRNEVETVGDWIRAAPSTGSVLDVGCGAGAWTEIFALRFASVVGMEQSESMLAAARARLRSQANVSLLGGDVRSQLPEGPFDLIFLGGLCMYLNDEDAVLLLRALARRLNKGASLVLRETTVATGTSTTSGQYQAVYRSVDRYRRLFEQAGFVEPEVRRNYAYNSMEIAVELVEQRRRRLGFMPKESPFLGALTWYALRGTAPMTFWLLPRLLSRLGVRWPSLQNHFFRLGVDPRTAS